MPYTASLLWTRPTSHGKLYSMFCPQTFHVRETSPGKNKIFLSMCLPHLLQAIPGSIGTSTCHAALSLLTALYVISVRQTGDLPTPSFRFCLTADTLGVQLYPSHYRAGSGLSPVRFCPCRAHKKSESTHYQTRQFAQGNIYLDVLQSLSSFRRSPIYHTFVFFLYFKNPSALLQISASTFSAAFLFSALTEI